DLDRYDPTGLHHVGELAEGRRAVVGGADGPNLSFLLQALEQRQLVGPRHQVVHLVQIDQPAEVLQGSFGLGASGLGGEVQILVATRASPRRPSSARARTRSASPYIGDESKRFAPA